jgi:hypothetical protein
MFRFLPSVEMTKRGIFVQALNSKKIGNTAFSNHLTVLQLDHLTKSGFHSMVKLLVSLISIDAGGGPALPITLQ